jgi:Cu(I)/Ag(I) efflux system membrane fusion protein
MSDRTVPLNAALGFAALVAVTSVVATLALTGSSAREGPEHAHETPAQAAQAPTQYTCPMHPSVISDRPGACPVCQMDLVPKKSGADDSLDDEQLAAAGHVALSPSQRVLANVQTIEAKKGNLKRELRAVGLATYNERGLATIPSWVNGRIDKLWIKETGKPIARGQRLMTIYSPELLSAQQELIALDKKRKTTDQHMYLDPLIEQARKKLELLGMTNAQLNRILQTHSPMTEVTISATASGTITKLYARQGQYVSRGTPLLDLADLSDVWIDAQLYQHQRASIREGMRARVTSTAYPGRSFQGHVTFIQPSVNVAARTTVARVELKDPEEARLFTPGMYTTIYFEQGQDEAPAVLIPLDAIIRTGKHDYAYVALPKEPGDESPSELFERRELHVSAVDDGVAQILRGIEPGELVVATGGFLIDSELQLRSPASLMQGHEAHAHGPVELDAEGTTFKPPISPARIPDGAWYCDMGTVEYARADRGDGQCPVCGMRLKHKLSSTTEEPAQTPHDHSGHSHGEQRP